MNESYYMYITTNPGKTVLYIGMTNDLYKRIYEHHENRGNKKTFAGRYYCYNLIYYEEFVRPMDAIRREKEVKGWKREKKLELIKSTNPNLSFLNKSI